MSWSSQSITGSVRCTCKSAFRRSHASGASTSERRIRSPRPGQGRRQASACDFGFLRRGILARRSICARVASSRQAFCWPRRVAPGRSARDYISPPQTHPVGADVPAERLLVSGQLRPLVHRLRPGANVFHPCRTIPKRNPRALRRRRRRGRREPGTGTSYLQEWLLEGFVIHSLWGRAVV